MKSPQEPLDAAKSVSGARPALIMNLLTISDVVSHLSGQQQGPNSFNKPNKPDTLYIVSSKSSPIWDFNRTESKA